MAGLREEESNSAVVGEPLETRGVGLTEGLKQSLHIAPTVRTQQALEFKCLRLADTLIAVTSSQI